VTDRALRELRDAGLSRLAISIDGPTAESHDWFRGTDGSFDRSLEILQAARELGLSTQVNTTLTRTSIGRFDEMAELVEDLGISLWSLFFLVPTGRAQERDVAEADAFEEAFHRMYDLSRRAPFDIKSTAAPHYRRVILQRQVEERKAGLRDAPPEPLTAGIGFSLRRSAAGGIPAGRAKGVNDGSGFLFVSHVGEIYPSGFLPLTVGNVMEHDIVQVYREDPLLQALRDPDALKGKCGVCEFRSVCGGSRARAWAVTGDPLESEPYCSYIPARWRRKLEQDEAEAKVGMAGGAGQSAHHAVRDPARPGRPGLRLPTVD
jgi:AdoMet-dependent heme synthase